MAVGVPAPEPRGPAQPAVGQKFVPNMIRIPPGVMVAGATEMRVGLRIAAQSPIGPVQPE